MTKRKITHQGCGRQCGRPEPSFEALSRPLLGGAGELSFGGFAIILCVSRPTSSLRRVVRPLCRIAPTCEEDASARSEVAVIPLAGRACEHGRIGGCPPRDFRTDPGWVS